MCKKEQRKSEEDVSEEFDWRSERNLNQDMETEKDRNVSACFDPPNTVLQKGEIYREKKENIR